MPGDAGRGKARDLRIKKGSKRAASPGDVPPSPVPVTRAQAWGAARSRPRAERRGRPASVTERLRAERFRQQFARVNLRRGPRARRHGSACPARRIRGCAGGRRRRASPVRRRRRDQDRGDPPPAGRDHRGDRPGLRAGAYRVGGVLDVAAGMERAALVAEGGADPEAGIRRVRPFADRPAASNRAVSPSSACPESRGLHGRSLAPAGPPCRGPSRVEDPAPGVIGRRAKGRQRSAGTGAEERRRLTQGVRRPAGPLSA